MRKKALPSRWHSVKIDADTYALIKSAWTADEVFRVSISGVIRQAVLEMAQRRAVKQKKRRSA